MKKTTRGIIEATVLFITSATQAQIQTNGLQLVPPDQVPTVGTFWLANSPTGRTLPPLPFPPGDLDVPIYALTNGQFLVENSDVDYGTPSQAGIRLRTAGMSTMSIPFPGGGGDPGDPPPPPPNIPNYQKYIGHAFSLIDTNDAAANDPTLYSACLSFPDDTNTAPTLQIAPYGTNAVIIKANHFDYSSETRDFALLICDKVETPTWKSIDLCNSTNSQDGWLIQGLVANWQVADPMFMMVSNINLAYNAFFRAIPYSGPQIMLTGAEPYDTVSETITLTAAVTDLSGTTNQQHAITVNGLPTSYSLGSGNTISIDTRYAPNSIQEVEVAVGNQSALVFDPENPMFDVKTAYATTAPLPLDFENDTYLVWAGDMCSPDVGINYILFAVSEAQDIAATITDPSNGQTLASYGGYVPYPATVEIPWNFTTADGVTPYTNDTYSVTFVAQDLTTLVITNTIDRSGGVRAAGACILTYEEEDPKLSAGPYLNSEANKWIGSLAGGLYSALYSSDFASLTQYSPADIGPNRDTPTWATFPWVLTGSYQFPWALQVYYALTNAAFSDFGFYMGHGNGTGIGGHGPGSSFVTGYLPSTDVRTCVPGSGGPRWRMRKVALWACYTDASTPPADRWGNPIDTTAGGTYPSWRLAFGIRTTRQQMSSWMAKNVGLFFGGALPQGGYSGTFGGTCPEVATMLDDLWVTGPYSYPGGCDPTYAFSWAVAQIEGMCPQVMKGMPVCTGFGYLPFTGIYDGNLLTNDVSNIKR